MVKINKPKELVITSLLVLLYSYLSLAYFIVLDSKFYVRRMFDSDITFVFPIPYIVLVALFALLYSALSRQKLRVIAYPILAMAVILPLFYLLTELKIGIRTTNPFGGNRGIYGAYAAAYFFFIISLFSLLGGIIFRKLLKKEISGPLACGDSRVHNFVFHLPIFVYFAYIVAMLFVNGFIPYATYALVLFFFALSFKRVSLLLERVKVFFVRFVQNERVFLIAIFIIAFLIRYLWGVRLLGITGENFIFASDDGPGYDSFAAIIAGGEAIPQNDIFAISGFAYWYFLATIYKIFGLHNFKAIFTIQSFIGATLPVFTYFIAKRAFKTNLAPVVASIMVTLNMALIFLSVVIAMEAIYIPLVALALTATVYFILNEKGIDSKKAFLLGILFGLAYNARPPELILFPLVLAFLIYMFMRRRLRAIKIAPIIASLFIGFTLIISVQYVRNYIVYGERRFVPTAAALSFEVSSLTGGFSDENKTLGDMGFNPFKDLKGSINTFMRNPFTVSTLIAKGSAKRFLVLWLFPNFGVFDPLYLVNPSSGYSGYFFRFPVYAQFYGWLLAVVGIVAALISRKNFRGVVILLMFLLYMSSRVAVFYVLNSRYRGVLLPVAIVFFAYGVDIFYNRVKESYGKVMR